MCLRLGMGASVVPVVGTGPVVAPALLFSPAAGLVRCLLLRRDPPRSDHEGRPSHRAYDRRPRRRQNVLHVFAAALS